MKNKVLVLTALDGSKWHLPAAIVLADIRANYPNDPGHDSDLLDWAKNNMNWSDVKAQAVKVKEADALDMDDSWANGQMEVIEAEQPATPVVPAAVVQAAQIARKMPTRALGRMMEKAGLVRGIETSIVLGHSDDHLSIIQAIAADGLSVETTPERRLVLEAIRTACERTIALQQPTQVQQ
jgi:hypothetical protein